MGFDSRYDRLPMIISEIRSQISMTDDIPQKLAGLYNLVYCLEQQLQKIQAGEVEARITIVEEIGQVREEIEHWNKLREAKEALVTKDYINALKGISAENGGTKIALNRSDDKKDWLLSAKLWSTFKVEEVEKGKEAMMSTQNVREFSPDKKRTHLDDDGLSLSLSGSGGSGSGNGSPLGYPSKKQRRRWTSDLHARFVNALELLGGAPAATPGRIRDVMQVEGLTYEEIKSHLQKYRLQIREPSSPSGDGVNHSEMVDHEMVDHSGSSEGPSQLGVSGWATEW